MVPDLRFSVSRCSARLHVFYSLSCAAGAESCSASLTPGTARSLYSWACADPSGRSDAGNTDDTCSAGMLAICQFACARIPSWNDRSWPMLKVCFPECRNRQVSAFFEIVEYLQPGYVVMENVMDSLNKQDGVYVKHATGTLLTLRYQTRTGTCMAGLYGVAQGRWRCASPLPFDGEGCPGERLEASSCLMYTWHPGPASHNAAGG